MPNNMELDRPNRPASAASTATTTSDLFICFTSRLSHSSSMRMSSKSILSPGRSGDNNNKPPISLQSSLSRRMRSNNGSLKGAQSPMFPPGVTTNKKRGCAFENPEPSSPKVTCIGQVRVKTKKQGKKMKMNMKAYTSRSTGEVSFRRIETEQQQQGQNRNQSWGQLPLTICDALKEFSCFIPCRSSSCGGSGEGEKQGREDSVSSSSTCGGAVFRWLVAFHGEGRTRDIELVVGEEEGERREEEEEERECSRRRSIFDDMDFNVEEICDGGGKEEGARVSICVPPKNALLLMRCRSDPVKMSALANKLWESPPTKEDKEEGDETEEVVVREETEERRRSGVREDEKIESFSNFGGVVVREEAERRSCVREDEKIESLSDSDGVVVREEAERRSSVKEDEKIESFSDKKEPEEEMFGSNDSIDVDEERISVSDSGDEFVNFAMLFEEEEPDAGQSPAPPESTPSIENQEEEEEEDPDEIQQTVIGKDSIFEQTEDSNNQPPPLESQGEELEEVAETQSRSAEQSPISVEEEEEEKQFDDKSRKEEEEEETMKKAILPDCLLLMMCEPKLSMEVSEETWVCSTDFLRPWLPERHRQHQLKKLNAAGDEPQNNKKQHKSKKNRGKTESNPPLPPSAALQPPRSSCSFPISMASLIEKKLGCAVAYEPFVLTRCKSEPMRTASAKLGAAQELACFWKNSKIEPHRPANCGIGAAGVGF